MPRSNVYGTPTKEIDSVAVIGPVDMEIPGRTRQLIQGKRQLILGELKEKYSSFCEGLVEPMNSAPPTNLCIARTPSPVTLGNAVVLQVMNVSPHQ